MTHLKRKRYIREGKLRINPTLHLEKFLMLLYPVGMRNAVSPFEETGC